MSSFFLGEERVTTELLPFAIAAPTHEARAFLATPPRSPTRPKHMVFFDRFYREVFGVDAETLSQNLQRQRPGMNAEWGSCSTASSTTARRRCASIPRT
jgi:ribonucleoside-diphosphate reductase beta chain